MPRSYPTSPRRGGRWIIAREQTGRKKKRCLSASLRIPHLDRPAYGAIFGLSSRRRRTRVGRRAAKLRASVFSPDVAKSESPARGGPARRSNFGRSHRRRLGELRYARRCSGRVGDRRAQGCPFHRPVRLHVHSTSAIAASAPGVGSDVLPLTIDAAPVYRRPNTVAEHLADSLALRRCFESTSTACQSVC